MSGKPIGGSGVLGNLELQHILTNLATLIEPITQMVLAVSVVSGIVFIFKGIAMLHNFGQAQNMMSKPHGVAGPFIYIGIGAILMYMPATTNVFSLSILGNVPMLFSSNDVVELVGESGNFTVKTSAQYEKNASNKLMDYATDFGLGQEWSNLIDTIVMFIQLIGFIAFVRGWFILASVGNPGGAQQGAFAKGLIHIIGGIIAINFIPAMKAIAQIAF
jgi:intracellular multiplication protein IcmC